MFAEQQLKSVSTVRTLKRSLYVSVPGLLKCNTERVQFPLTLVTVVRLSKLAQMEDVCDDVFSM